MKDIKELLVTLNIPYKNFSLYVEAFTHSSFHQLQKKTKDYERLEFLGDSIVNFVVAKSLFTTHPEMAQGPLTVARSMLVKTKSLANHARLLHFDEYIKVGPTIDRKKIKLMDPLLEDVFESVMGAILLDTGVDFTYSFIEGIFAQEVKDISIDDTSSSNYKAELQEAMQAEFKEGVRYSITNESGPDHNKHFEVEVSFNDVVLGKGDGSNKKEAEQNAAKDALSKRVTGEK